MLVDSDGRLAGTLTAAEVLALIEQRRAASDQPSDQLSGQPVEQPVAGGER